MSIPPPIRIMAKRASKPSSEAQNKSQDWENHIIIRVPEDCVEKMNKIVNEDPKSEELGILFMDDMRHAQIQLGNRILSGKLLDLPCINEVYKTLDKKNIYKVADLSQILVCSHDILNTNVAEVQPSTSSSSAIENEAEAEAKKMKKETRQWQYPHGLTPPMKSARRRRFRKTKKKKYMDAPEVEKELKRLLRADLEAYSVSWEVVEDQKKTTEQTSNQPPLSEVSLFGATLSSSGEEDENAPEVKEE